MGSPDISSAAEDRGTVAFDVFDTLLVRPFWKPKDLFRYMGAMLRREGFADARIAAERKARETKREIVIDEIYDCLDPSFSDLKEKEMSLEISLCRADPDIVPIFDSLVAHGKRIVLISDMYLPSVIIRKMAEKAGFHDISAVYVSGENGCSKADGGLYRKLLSDLSLEPSDVLMIGDRPDVDVKRAREAGIDAIRWVPLRERYSTSHKPEAKFAERFGWMSSVIAGMDAIYTSAQGKGYWYDVSRRFGGPAALMFAQYIMKVSEDYDRLVFLSRDGYNPMKVYEEICGSPKDRVYLYSSRMIARMYGTGDLDDPTTVASYMIRMGHEVKPGHLGFPDRKSCLEFSQEHRSELTELYEKGHERCGEYIRDTAGDGEILLVDATTKKFTSQIDIQSYLGRQVGGCYYAITAETTEKATCYANRSGQKFSSSYVNLIEFFFGSGEPGLKDIDGGPVFYDPSDDAKTRHAEEILEGEIDCARSYKEMFGDVLPYVTSDVIDGWLDVLMAHEKGDDPETISGIKWAIDTRHTLYRHLIMRRSEIPFMATLSIVGKLKH